MRIVIVSAHPDDLETGMGGTAFLLKQAGHEIISLVTTFPTDEGPTYKGFQGKGWEVRTRESMESHKLLGIEPHFWDFKELDPEMNADIRKEFGEKLLSFQPDAVFTHWPVDLNPDHRLIAALTIEPFLQRGVNTELFAYEVFSAVGRPQNMGFYPTHYVNITDVVETKKQMVFCMKSQGPEALWAGNLEIQQNRAFEMPGNTVMDAEAFVRITRYGDIHPELARIFRPTNFRLPAGMGVDVDPAKIGLTV